MKLHGHVKRLHKGRSLRLALDAGDRLLVARGLVWLTRMADPNGNVLRAGQEFSTPTGEEVVLEALGQTAVLGLRCVSREAPLRAHVQVSSGIQPLLTLPQGEGLDLEAST